MTPEYHVLRAADADLDHQADYLAQTASLDVALRFHDAARTTFEKIAQNPGIGQKWESREARLEGLRVWRVEGFERYMIFYRPVDEGLEIVRVLHGARDIDSVLDDG